MGRVARKVGNQLYGPLGLREGRFATSVAVANDSTMLHPFARSSGQGSQTKNSLGSARVPIAVVEFSSTDEKATPLVAWRYERYRSSGI